MSLYEELKRRGYSFRQHLEEESWTRRKLTVVDLDDAQRAALEAGGADELKRVLASQGLWSFPAPDIEKPLTVQADVVLAQGGRPTATVIAPDSPGALNEMASELIDAVHERFGVTLPFIHDGESDLGLLQSQHVVVFGGSHESPFAMDMALRYQTGFVDAAVPGDDGWVVTTHAGLDASGYNVAQIAASPSRREEAMSCLRESIAHDENRIGLRHTHRIRPGREMREHFPPWGAFAAALPRGIPQLAGRDTHAPQDPVALADLLSEGLHSGGPDVNLVNNQPIDIAVKSTRYYQMSGDPRALQLFRELLFRLADYYLKTPEGASYPSDLDFRLGHLILYYARLEHDPVFADEERLILANLLLACTRSVYEYTLKCWPIKPDEPTRHNHETFAARSLLFAADYFARYGIPDVEDWRRRADAVFSGGMWHRFKQSENANLYEQFAFEHGATYSAFTGRKFDLFDPDCLRWAAMRNVVTTDNFFRPVDYGDAGLRMRNDLTDILPTILTSQRHDPTLQWYSHEAFARNRHYLLPRVAGMPGLRRGDPGATAQTGAAPSSNAWELVPLDAEFAKTYCPEFPQAYAFDKLAFRTGWTDDDQYVLLEGVGNQAISHGHNEVNGIVRLNHLGRHWVVSNGYGRRAGVTNVRDSFNTRVRGPEDHNMLVLRRGGEIVRGLPVCSALLQRGQTGDIAFATGALLGYDGTDWLRTLIIVAGRFVLVIDRVNVVQPGLENAHVEWSCLGNATPMDGGFRLDQQGVFMDVTSDSCWPAELGVADQSSDWKAVLESGEYPYATFPLARLVFEMPNVEAGQTSCLATLFAASRPNDAAYRVSEPEPGLIRVAGPHGQASKMRVDDGDLSVQAAGSSLEVRFAASPEAPRPLRAFSAGP